MVSGATEESAMNNANEKIINVWLIGGQSNAVGYGRGAPSGAAEDSRYYTGFDNVLYFGNHEQFKYNEDDFVPTSIGLGRTADNDGNRIITSGSEIGIANALGDTGEMNAVIKFAYGGTYLYPKQSASVNDNAKTWTSPSYINAHPEVNTGTNIGALYNLFVDTVTEGIALLREKGYTPVIKGMWWMQGENEGMNATHAAAYEELLTCLVNDVRGELENITGQDCSDMPFICGNVMRNPADATQYPALDTVNAAQAAVAGKLKNVGVLTKSDYSSKSFFGYHDGWHFNVDTYNYMGEKFVEMVLDMRKENLVSVIGEGIESTGSGIKGENESVTVTFNAKDGYTVNGITMAGNSVTLDGNGSYTFTLSSDDVVFNVNTVYSGTDAITEYGTIPAGFNIAEKYPFALFKNGVFVGAYEYYSEALLSVEANSMDSYTLLLRRDYTTVTADMTDAPTAFGNSFTLDLGGNTMVRGNRAYIFEIYSNSNDTYTTTINVKNGLMHSTGDFSLVGLNYSALSNISKVYNFRFDNVIFSTDYIGRGSAVIIESLDGASTTDSAGLGANIVFNGCTFDFGATSATMMSFSAGAAAKTVVNAEINGGSIVSENASYSLYTSTSEDNVTIGKLNDSYMTVTLPSSVTPPMYTYITENGEIYGIDASGGTATGDNTVYNLGVQSLNTKYGAITEAFKDSQTYKFALFKVDSASATGYTFHSGYTTFGDACLAAGLKGSPVSADTDFVILFRTAYTNTAGVDNMQNFYNNVTIDLGGNAVTLTTQHFLPLYIGNPSSAVSYGKITVKNGTIINNAATNATITAVRLDSGTLSNNLTYNVECEDVTFKVANASKSLNGALSFSGNKGTAKMTVNSTFKNCTFDYTDAPSGTVMVAANATQRIANVTFVGCKVIAGASNAFTFLSTDSGDHISFKANDNGATVSFLLPEGTSAPTVKIGDLEYVKINTEGGKDVYNLIENNTYGNIPVQYADADSYPLLVFKADGSFVRGYATFGEACLAAGLKGVGGSQVGSADSVILVRKSFTNTAGQSNLQDFFNNITIDLGGNTVTLTTQHFLPLYLNNPTSSVSYGKILIKNGTFVNNSASNATITPIRVDSGAIAHNLTFNVDVDNVTFKIAGTSKSLNGAVSMSDNKGTAILTLNANLTDCTFDYTNAPTGAVMINVAPTQRVANVNIIGGNIIGGANPFVFINDDADDSVLLGTNSDNNYPILSLVAGSAALQETFNGGTMEFVYSENLDGRDIYKLSETLDEDAIETVYGTIPGENADNLFVVFTADKTFIGGYNSFGDACRAAGLKGSAYSAVSGADSIILVRGSFTNTTGVDNMQNFFNNVTIDLGGNTVTLTTQHFLPLYLNNPSSAVSYGKITVKNGTILNNSASNATISAIRVDSGNITQNLTYNVDVENVTFKVSSTSKSLNGAISMSDNKGSALLTLNANLIDCTFDFADAPVNTVMINVSATQRIANVNIKGGKILGGTNSSFKLIAQDSADTVLMAKSGDAYTELSLVSGSTAPTARYNNNTLGFMYASTADGYDIYELLEVVDNKLSITVNDEALAKYALTLYLNGSVVSLPYSGSFLSGSSITLVAKTASKHNYTVTANGNALDEMTFVLSEDTTISIVIAEKASAVKIPITGVTASHASANDTSWDETKLKDGIRVSAGSSYGYSTGGLGTQTPASPVVLTFDLGSVQRINQLSIFPRSDKSTADLLYNANYPCDFTISVSTNGSDYATVLTVTGEKVLFPKQQCYSFEDVDARYVKLTITKVGAIVIDEAGSTRHRVQLAEVEIYCNSELTTVKTDYGIIPNDYIDANKYPIVVFKADKTFVKGFATYKEALIAAGFNGVGNSLVNGEDCVILFRNNYTHVNANQMIGAFYNNVVMDLGGNTVTLSNQHFLALYGGGNPSNGTTFGTITIKNGSFINNSANTTVTPVRLDGKWSVQVTYTVNIENVKFSVASTSGSSLGAVSTAAPNGTPNVLNVTLTNCIFDFANSKSGAAMINVSTTRAVNAVIYGGQILGGASNSFNLVTKDAADKVVFAKNANGEYIKLVLNKDTAAPSTNTVYTTADGIDCVFVKADATTYTLYPKVMLGFKIKSSVSLWSNLVYNVYIPTANVKGFTVNGNEPEYTTVTMDEVEYYLVSVPLAAGDSLSDIEVRVTLNAGSTDVSAKWTLSVLSYVSRVLGDGCDPVTEALMKDMLSYARAAHIFFGRTDGIEAKLSAIEAILGADYDVNNKVIIPENSAKKPEDDTYFTYITADLGEIPSFRFYLADGYGKDDFSFKVGGAAVEATEGSDSEYGRYLEIVVYAYRMCDDVTYTVKDNGVTESYNIYAYYEWAKTLNNDNLVLIVERLMKYSESADKYRDSVLEGNA